MKQLLLLFFFLASTRANAQGTLTLQDKPFVYDRTMDSSIWHELQNDKLFLSLQEQEQMMFYWTNYFRKNPKPFFNEVIKEFIKQFPEANTREIGSLENDINKITEKLPLLLPDKGLLLMTKLHSSDLVKRGGVISHRSSAGKVFVQRIKDAGFYKCGAENIYVGTNDALEALIALMVDYGVPDKGHRMNLLDPKFNKMGVSFPFTSPKKGLLVQVFACL